MEYSAYKARASFFGATARTLEEYLDLVFRRGPAFALGGTAGRPADGLERFAQLFQPARAGVADFGTLLGLNSRTKRAALAICSGVICRASWDFNPLACSMP